MHLAKWYTRIIGIAFIAVVITLISEYLNAGFSPESMHKLFHVLLGVIIVSVCWNREKFWKPLCVANGAFFSYLALFGWLFPDFAGLAAFSLMDTLLHAIVGVSGLAIGLLEKER
ncbi:hypothetical protein HY491_01795 [Candidatus Woesearchaeota archaeon]|nr:hypothetical protein [Candidatus Woesearchaeota archaeon]